MVDVTEHQGLVYSIASKMGRRYGFVDLDVLISAGMEGLCKAGALFKPELGFQFSTYAYQAIQRAMMREIMDTSKHSSSIDFSDVEHEARLPSREREWDETEEYCRNLDRVRSQVAQLPPKHRSLIEMRLAGKSYREMSEILGVSRTSVQIWCNTVVRQLREALL